MKNKGFTLVELLGVLVILAILMGIAIPAVYKYLAKSKTDAMETMAKATYEAAHSKATSDLSLTNGTKYKVIEDLVKGGFMDKTVDPDNDRKVCDGEVKISTYGASENSELDNYVYRVHIKCSHREINRIYTTDGQEIDVNDDFPFIVLSIPEDRRIQFKNSSTFNFGKISIIPEDETKEVIKASYSSSTPDVCTVDSTSGIITPQKLGECKIEANVLRYDKHKNLLGERTDTITYEVVNEYTPAYSISYTPSDKKLELVNDEVTKTGQITVKSTDESFGTFTTTYSSSDTSICTVDNTGKVTPKKGGNCTITTNIIRRDPTTNEELGRVKETVDYTVDSIIKTYTISYDGNGSDGGTAPSTITCRPGAAVTLSSSCGFTKTGHTCTGWDQNITKCPSENTTVKAQWRANTYTVSYAGNSNTGGTTAPSTCTYGAAISPRANGFTRNYYHFTSWSYPNNSTTCKGNTTLTANWAGNQVSIAYKIGDNYAHIIPSGYHVGKTDSGEKYLMNSSNSIYVHIAYGTSPIQSDGGGLWNVQNSKWLYIKKSSSKDGDPKSGEEWVGTDNATNNCRKVKFNQKTNYTANQICNNISSSCVCRLRVQWG